MWHWTKLEKIKWPEKITNEQVLNHTGEIGTLLNNIMRRKDNWIDHVRRYYLIHDVLEGSEKSRKKKNTLA